MEDQTTMATQDGRSVESFRNLPNEVLDLVLWQLDLASAKNLRLTSTAMAKRCQSPGFKRFFASKDIELTEEGLIHMWSLASHPVFGPAVKHLTLTVVFFDESRWTWAYRKSLREHRPRSSQQAKEYVDHMIQKKNATTIWLMEHAALCLVSVLEKLGPLSSLTLDTRTYQHPGPDKPPRQLPEGTNWQSLWCLCQHVFDIVTWAMLHGGVMVESFSVFDGYDSSPISGKIQSADIYALSTILPVGFLGNLAIRAKNLTLAFSTFTLPPPETNQLDPLEHDDGLVCVTVPASSSRARDPQNFPGVAEFLKLTPELEGLNLRMYNTLDGLPRAYHNVFAAVAADVRLPNLQRLTLRGIWSTEDALLLFLRRHPDIAELDLRDFHLTATNWDRVFRHLRTMASLKTLHLENLWSSNERLLNLEPTDSVFDDGLRGHGHSFPTRRGMMVHTRDIGMEEVREGLDFKQLSGGRHGKGSKFLMGWLKNRRLLYGPPEN